MLDGLFTLLLMEKGAYEVNPLMAYALHISPSVFVITKYALTCVTAVVALMLRDGGMVRGKRLPPHALLAFFVGCFALIVACEIFLFSVVVA